MSDLRLIVFDVDGTLLDSGDFAARALRRGYRATGVTPPGEARMLSIIGLSLPEAVAALHPDLSPEEADGLAKAFGDGFIAERAATGGEAASPLFPGARAVLDHFAAQDFTLMGVATGKKRRGLNHWMEAHGLSGLFQTIQTADFHPSKPHPAMLETALAETGVAPGAAIMVGDTSFDMEMGATAGFRTIAVDWGHHGRDRLGAADLVISDFSDLPGAAERLWGGS